MKHLIYKSTYPVICIVLLSFSCAPEKLDPLTYEDPIFDSQIDVMESVQEDKMAPIGRLLDTDSASLLTDSFKGKLLFIDFWATWCTPCIAEIPKFH